MPFLPLLKKSTISFYLKVTVKRLPSHSRYSYITKTCCNLLMRTISIKCDTLAKILREEKLFHKKTLWQRLTILARNAVGNIDIAILGFRPKASLPCAGISVLKSVWHCDVSKQHQRFINVLSCKMADA